MDDDLLEIAYRQAQDTDPSVRAAALLRISRAQFATNASQARQTLLEALDAVQKLPASVRGYLLQEARTVAAAISPEVLAEIPHSQFDGPEHFGPPEFQSVQIVQTMLAHGHVEAAFDYLIRETDQESFPYLSVWGVLNQLDPNVQVQLP
jgi:hypothetical protein